MDELSSTQCTRLPTLYHCPSLGRIRNLFVEALQLYVFAAAAPIVIGIAAAAAAAAATSLDAAAAVPNNVVGLLF